MENTSVCYQQFVGCWNILKINTLQKRSTVHITTIWFLFTQTIKSFICHHICFASIKFTEEVNGLPMLSNRLRGPFVSGKKANTLLEAAACKTRWNSVYMFNTCVSSNLSLRACIPFPRIHSDKQSTVYLFALILSSKLNPFSIMPFNPINVKASLLLVYATKEQSNGFIIVMDRIIKYKTTFYDYQHHMST